MRVGPMSRLCSTTGTFTNRHHLSAQPHPCNAEAEHSKAAPNRYDAHAASERSRAGRTRQPRHRPGLAIERWRREKAISSGQPSTPTQFPRFLARTMGIANGWTGREHRPVYRSQNLQPVPKTRVILSERSGQMTPATLTCTRSLRSVLPARRLSSGPTTTAVTLSEGRNATAVEEPVLSLPKEPANRWP